MRGVRALREMDNSYANEPSKANAERVAATVKGQHPVFQELRVVEDENSFDYQYRTPQVQTPVKLETAPTGERVQRMKKEIKEYAIVDYGQKYESFENHHGILDVWASFNIVGYKSRASDNPTIALSSGNHAATKAVYRNWLKEKTGKPVGGKIDWKDVSWDDVKKLAEDMFDAASVPKSSREEYYKTFEKYIQ